MRGEAHTNTIEGFFGHFKTDVRERSSLDVNDLVRESLALGGAELGLENVDYRVIDAQRIELGDDSVDGVLCRFGYMLMADPAAALPPRRGG